jgi:hypothetical protein
MPERREARLRPEFAHLYPGIAPDRWVSAHDMNDMVISARLQAGRRSGEILGSRLLDARHFEFRGGFDRRGRAAPFDQPSRLGPGEA